MSATSKIVLLSAVGLSASIIGYVHYKQSEDRLKLHEGVVRDVEQQQRRKHENRYRVQQQIDMTKQLKQMQVLDDEAKSRNENSTPSDITKQKMKQTQVVQEAKKPKENVPPSDTEQQRIPSKSDNPPSSS